MMRIVPIVAWLLLMFAPPALGVRPQLWSHRTEADFAAGELDKTVLTSLGEVLLARAVRTLLKPSEELGMVSAVAVDGRGKVFLAVAPAGEIYRLERGRAVKLAKLPGVLVRCLAFREGHLLAGVSGGKAGLYRIDSKGKVTPIWTDEQVTYVWAVAPAPRGGYYVATGAKGRVYRVGPDGRAEVVYRAPKVKNIMSLAPGPGGQLYAGTGEDGLIVQIDPARKAGRVLYDAPEKEISCIVVAPDGVVYAATSDAAKTGPGGRRPSDRERGVPEGKPRPGARQTSRPSRPTSRPAGGEARARGGGAGASAGGRKPARRSGQTKIVVTRPAGGSARPASGPAGGPVAGGGKGNAVYRIDTEGFVRAVFRRPVTIFAMVLQGDVLTLGTGHGGGVFAVDLADERVSMVVKVDPKDVVALAAGPKGRLVLGTADQAAVYALGADLARKGTLVSKVLDAGQVARWGTVRVRADVPAWCKVTVATRSGNVAKPDERTWSDWSAELPVNRGWARIVSPPGRFLQYRLSLQGTSKVTPVVDQVEVVYQVGNLAPVVRAVTVVPSAHPKRREERAGGRKPFRMIRVQASDPNGDALAYSYYFRRRGRKVWIKLAEKSSQSSYAWDTTGLADGPYEVRVVASDEPDNPRGQALEAGRISRAVVVDNNPPAVSGLKAKDAGGGRAVLSGKVADTTSRIVRIDYAVDTNDEWTPVLPADGICDSPGEAFSVTIPELEPGVHRLAVRVTDEYNNTGYASVEVTVGK